MTPIRLWVGKTTSNAGLLQRTESRVRQNNFYTCETEKCVSMTEHHSKPPKVNRPEALKSK
jgi:hypothetical protein